MIGFSNALPVYGIERLRWRAQVERALKIQNAHADARMKRSRLNPLLFVLALAALAFAAWMHTTNWNLRHALQSAHVVRAAIEKDTTRTRDRAAQAEKAILAAEQSMAEVRARLAEARHPSTRQLGDLYANPWRISPRRSCPSRPTVVIVSLARRVCWLSRVPLDLSRPV